MIKPNFGKCTKEATRLLYNQKVSDRILNVRDLKYDKNIIFDSIQAYCQYTHTPIHKFLTDKKDMLKDGCMLYHPCSDHFIVLYNDEISYFEHRNWTLGHEIGHIYLEHTEDTDIAEIEAHYFASQLFMPEYSLHMMAKEHGRIYCEDVVEVFGVSPEAAYKCISTMNKRTKISSTLKDKEIWAFQKERIDMYYHCQQEGEDFRSTLLHWEAFKADYEHEMRMQMYAEMR